MTNAQRRSIVIDEKNNLIVAGAGTGKTSTILAKASYLINKGLAKPEEILILSFNNRVKDEIELKINNSFENPCKVETFHSMGLEIISKNEGKKPAVSKLSEDQLLFQRYIENLLIRESGLVFNNRLDSYFNHNIKKGNSALSEKIVNFLVYDSKPYKNHFDFNNLGDYYKYLRDYELRSLNGELVRSYEECEIANFLYLNGIEYEYESYYKHDVSSIDFPQYRPDFYLPQYDIYIEHFGINRNGETAPFINSRLYNAEIRWKRNTHKEYETKLIETYSYEKVEGVLLNNLSKKLLLNGVKFHRLPDDRIFDKLQELDLIGPTSALLSKFLNLYKSCNINNLFLRGKMESDRSRSFLDIFNYIYENYNYYLLENNEVDFNDMINKASQYIREGKHKFDYKYLLVDEFQDISQSRCNFLKALIESCNAKLFCVGDDWQAIYRFTGGDISLMTRFQEYFEPSEVMFLDKTFRFNDKILDVSSKFIMQNPGQIQKELLTDKHSDKPEITILWSKNDDEKDAIQKCLEDIIKKEKQRSLVLKNNVSIKILGRYNEDKPQDLDEIKSNYPLMDVEFLTVHRAKGVEADYIIFLNLSCGKYGFPCMIEDDPLIDVLLPLEEIFSNAEERRLFYVGITRSRNHVYLLVDSRFPSIFIDELISGKYDINVPKNVNNVYVSCPSCNSGLIVERKGNFPTFYSCNNFPYCSYKPDICRECGKGFLFKKNEKFICSNYSCNFEVKMCPRCKEGYLGVKVTDYLVGCSNYPKCTYKEPIS